MNASFERMSAPSPKHEAWHKPDKKVDFGDDSGIHRIPDDPHQEELDRLHLELNVAYDKEDWADIDRIQENMEELMEESGVVRDLPAKDVSEGMRLYRERYMKLLRLESALRDAEHEESGSPEKQKNYSELKTDLKERIKKQLALLGRGAQR